MKNKEKRILIVEGDKSDLDNIIFSVAWEHLDKVKGNEFSRAEAVEIMEKAACKANRRCIGGVCETCTSDMPKVYTHSSEAALDALLGKEAENGK